MNKFFSFVLVLSFVIGVSTSVSAQVKTPEQCAKLGTPDLRTECNTQYLSWLHGQLEAAGRVCDLSIEPERCNTAQFKAITKILVNVREKGMIPYNLDADHDAGDCQLTSDAPITQYLRGRCEVWRDYHKLEDLVASESRIRRQKEASALPLSKVRTIEEARPAPRKRSTGIPGSFLDNDESSKRSSKNEIEDNSAQSGRSFQKDCNKCTCTDGEILCTLKKCKEVVEFDEDDDNDYEPQPAPRRQVRRPAPRSHAPVRDYVDDQPIPAPPVYTPVVASTVKPTDGSLSLYVENTQRIFDGLRSSFTGTTTPFMVCVSHEGQPLEVVQVSGGYFRHQRIVVNIGSGNQLLSCAPAGATIYLSGMDSGKIVFLHYMVITSQVVQSGAGPVRAYRLMESRTYRSPSVPIRSEIQYKFQATMGPRK